MILRDHLRTIWTLPAGDANFATRWRLIKSERGIWQRRYWKRRLRDEDDFARTLITHSSARSNTALWFRCGIGPCSSSRRWVRLGVYAEDRAGSADDQIAPLRQR